jgi:hypothetical protein
MTADDASLRFGPDFCCSNGLVLFLYMLISDLVSCSCLGFREKFSITLSVPLLSALFPLLFSSISAFVEVDFHTAPTD